MSANNMEVRGAGGYHYYTLTAEGKRFVIGGVPERYADEYAETAAECDAVILLTSKPEFTGGVERLLEIKPDIEVYGGSAALRNIKEITNRPVNERLIKDGMEDRGIRFLVTPGLDWVDTVMALCDGVLFSGQMFSGEDKGRRAYYESRLAINRGFVLSALDRLEREDIRRIYPAYGETAESREMFAKYRDWAAKPKPEAKRAVVLYSSEYGCTRSLAQRAAEKLGAVCEAAVFDVKEHSTDEIVAAINAADMLAVGTNTINRNAPRGVWDVITRMDLVNKRGIPYFVFGSFGWAGDGIQLIDKTLAAMGLRRAAKPVETLFKPAEKDFARIDKAVKELAEYEN